MNSSTGMPFSTWTFLNTCSAIGAACRPDSTAVKQAASTVAAAKNLRVDPVMLPRSQDQHVLGDGRPNPLQTVRTYAWGILLRSALCKPWLRQLATRIF